MTLKRLNGTRFAAKKKAKALEKQVNNCSHMHNTDQQHITFVRAIYKYIIASGQHRVITQAKHITLLTLWTPANFYESTRLHSDASDTH